MIMQNIHGLVRHDEGSKKKNAKYIHSKQHKVGKTFENIYGRPRFHRGHEWACLCMPERAAIKQVDYDCTMWYVECVFARIACN